MTRRLSPAQVAMLERARTHADVLGHLSGRSELGPGYTTQRILRRGGLLTDADKLTDAGRQAADTGRWPG